MKYVYFKISAVFPDADAEKLNAFLITHMITSVSEQFVDDGQNSFWSIRIAIVDNLDETKKGITNASRRSSIDYREILTPEVFAIYARLRTLRNQLAEQESIPAYAIFTNEQLAEMAKLENPNKVAISQIEGIGEKRLARYVDQFLAELLTGNA